MTTDKDLDEARAKREEIGGRWSELDVIARRFRQIAHNKGIGQARVIYEVLDDVVRPRLEEHRNKIVDLQRAVEKLEARPRPASCEEELAEARARIAHLERELAACTDEVLNA